MSVLKELLVLADQTHTAGITRDSPRRSENLTESLNFAC
jgi:hypothetical protein